MRCGKEVGKMGKKFWKGVYKEGGSVENTASVLGRARCAPQALDRGGRKFFGILSEGEERERVEAREPLSIRNERQKEAGFVGERQERLLS